MWKFEILGPIAATVHGEPVDLGSPKQRALLACLVAHVDRPVSTGVLLDAVWGTHADPGAKRSLQTYVSNLRRILDPDKTGLIEGVADGYLLHGAQATIDWVDLGKLARFRSPGDAVRALGLWRGSPLEDVPHDWATGLIAGWEEIRLNAYETWADESIAGGVAAEVVPELERLVVEYPLRETLWMRLIAALAATGRQADALSAYQRLKTTLGEELGIDPSPELRALEESVLLEDPELRPTRSARARVSRLPAARTRLIGRDAEMTELGEHLVSHRLVTVHGPGGSGKTRLAISAAGEVDIDGFFVDLAPISDPRLVAQTVATALEVSIRSVPEGETVLAQLCRLLGDRPMLIVLDNCEHVIDAASEVADVLLGSNPNLRILATSRESLEIEGELIYKLDPLSLEADNVRSPALTLLLERADAVDARFDQSEEHLDVLGSVCADLDGIPLAIELAAAQLAFLSPEELAAGLDDRLAMTSGGRRRSARHQTLQATMDWSWGLLSLEERVLMAELSIFSGGVTLRAAEGICSGSSVRTNLGALVAKSLVIADPTVWGTRYRLLDTVRLYARLRLGDAEASTLDRHAEWYSQWVDSWTPEDHWLSAEVASRLMADRENLRQALLVLVGGNDLEGATRVVSGFLALWVSNHAGEEALEWTGSIDPEELPDDLRARWLLARGAALQVNGEFGLMWRLTAEAADLASGIGRVDLLAVALGMGAFGHLLDDLAANEAKWHEVLEVAEVAGMARIASAAWGMLTLGTVMRGGRQEEYLPLLEKTSSLAESVDWNGKIPSLARVYSLIEMGAFDEALESALRSAVRSESIELSSDVARANLIVAYAAARAGSSIEWGTALASAHEYFARAFGHRLDAEIVLRIAEWEVHQGDPYLGSELLTMVRREGLEFPESYVEYVRVRDHLRGMSLDRDQLGAARMRGEKARLDHALETGLTAR